MNNRTILIGTGIAAILVLAAIWTHSTPQPQQQQRTVAPSAANANHKQKPKAPNYEATLKTLNEAKAWLSDIEKQTPATWAEFKKTRHAGAATQQEAIDYNRKRVAYLEGQLAIAQRNQPAAAQPETVRR